MCVFGTYGALDPNSAKAKHLRQWKPRHNTDRVVSFDELAQAFKAASSGMSGLSLASIEDAMRPIYKTLPKNSMGRLSYAAASYLTDVYFTRVHHWHVQGLGLGPSNRNGVPNSAQGPGVLQKTAPAMLEAMFFSQAAGAASAGPGLSEVAQLAAMLHMLILGDAETLLQAAYSFHHVSLDDTLNETSLSRMLMTYQLISERGEAAVDISKRLGHPKFHVRSFADLGANIAKTFDYQKRYSLNSFVPRSYTHRSLIEITHEAMDEYGKWQDSDCQVMKKHLASLDPLRSGRVPLGRVYDQSFNQMYNVSESESYLREVGALDDSMPGYPQLLISNYVLSPTSCFSTSTYYQYCCLSECDSLMDSIERSIGVAEASPENMLELLGNLSTSTVEAPWEVPLELAEKMQVIAALHGGKVPIYGRLFRQWLHYAFPYDCPYPHVTEGASAVAAGGSQPRRARPEERLRLVEVARSNPAEAQPSLALWRDDEKMLFEPGPHGGSRGWLCWLGVTVATLSAVLSMAKSLLVQAQSGRQKLDGPGCLQDGSLLQKVA